MLLQLQNPDVTPEEAADTARGVLQGRAYLEAARPPSLRERLLDWIGERISDALNALSSVGGRGPIAWVIIGIFAAIILYLLFRLFQRFDPLPARVVSEKPEIDLIADRSAREWLDAAVEFEGSGEWRRGLRCRHRALAVELIDFDLVDPRPGITAGAIYREASANRPAIADPLGQATDLFQSVWYGVRVAGPDERDDFERHASVVRDRLREPVGASA